MTDLPRVVFPDPAVEVLDPRFERYRVGLARVERLATGLRWAEGPVWFGDADCLYVSDIPNDRIVRWDARSGGLSVLRQPSGFANGNARDHQGRLVSCEHAGRRIVRTEYDGTLTVLADAFDGRRLNSPNDLAVAPDGAIWFTDPPFGLANNWEGRWGESELPPDVYRIDPRSGAVEMVLTGLRGPNGLAFSPDGATLYVVDSRAEPNRVVLAVDVEDGRRLGTPRVLIDAGDGTADGIAVDADGNLWCGWGMGTPELDGVRVFSPEGDPIGRIRLPERCANVAFGGPGRSTLFMAAGTSIYRLVVNVRGL